MTLNQIRSDIRNIATSGSNPIDFKISDNQLDYWIHETRSMLISQAIAKKQDVSDIWIQTISCLALELVDESLCCEIDTGCPILKTVRQLPNTIETGDANTIWGVTDAMGNEISKTTYDAVLYDKYNKYTNKKPKWYLKNNYIYIINNEFLETINVDLLAEDPTSLSEFETCGGTTCYDSTSNYPCSLKMANEITNYVLKTKVYPFLSMPPDNTNDANNVSQQPNTKNL